METNAYVQTHSVEHNGRLRKYYRIAPNGIDRLNEFLQERAEVISVYDFIEQRARATDANGAPANS